MNKTEQCIDVLQQQISGIAEHAYYGTVDMHELGDTFAQFMEQLINQIEHVACEYLVVEVLGKDPVYLESLTKQPTAFHVQKLINQLKEKK